MWPFVRQLWMRLSGALQKKRTSEISYREVIKNSSNDDTTVAKQVGSNPARRCSSEVRLIILIPQIEKDLLRTMPSNACFNSLSGVGVPRLRRVLRGLAWLYPDIGYCQGTGMVRARGPPGRPREPAHAPPSSPLSVFPSPSGGFLSAALPGGGGRLMDDVRPDRRPPPSLLLLIHPAGHPNGPEGSSPTHRPVPARP